MISTKTWVGLVEESLNAASSANSLLTSLLDHMPIIVLVTDQDGNIVLHSAYCSQIEGVNLFVANENNASVIKSASGEVTFSPELLAQFRSLKIQDPDHVHWEELVINLDEGSTRTFQFCRYFHQSEDKELVVTLGHQAFEDHHLHAHIRDYKTQSHHLTFNDAVTGLANRTLFYDRLDQVFYSAKRNNRHFALMLIDLDQFRNFIQLYGTFNGDRLLKNVASKILEVVREVDTVARIGGDKFVIILKNVEDPETIQLIALKLLEAASAKIDVELQSEKKEVSCTASIGISLYPKDGESPDQLMRQADAAMSQAKTAGKNQHQFYIKAMTESAVNYLLLENELKKAIENSELKLYFQPQVDLRNGDICGLEVLCRWQHPKRGLLQPGHFIPIAEETGLIEPLGEWVLKESAALFNRWTTLGYDFGRISVNVSARQFRNPKFVELVRALLDECDLPEFRLELELTESATMENAAQAVENLNRLQQAGVAIALDDFGTGYSSLSYIQRFPIQRLKIDRSFVNELGVSDSAGATAKSIIDLANNMSMELVAEGVERKDQVNWLMARGCYVVQGSLFSEPLSETELTSLAHDEKRTKFDKGLVSFLV